MIRLLDSEGRSSGFDFTGMLSCNRSWWHSWNPAGASCSAANGVEPDPLLHYSW
jgi:hypothetical protein